MDSPTVQPSPKIEQSGNVRIITFTGDKVRHIQEVIAKELEGNVGSLADRHLLLDFTNVEMLSGAELETLVTLHEQMKDCGGRLTLFNLGVQVYEVIWDLQGVSEQGRSPSDFATLLSNANRRNQSTMKSDARTAPKVENCGEVKIITFTTGQKRDVENVIDTELKGLTDGLGESHLFLDFTNVEFITSVELGTLVGLNKKMKASGGLLTLFNLSPHVFEVFTATHLNKLIGICREG
jgi:anti-anti-sigma factor